jgi:hypothetical protein
MMLLQYQVCNWEQSLWLRKLGVAQSGYFHWFTLNDNKQVLQWYGAFGAGTYKSSLSAFTVAELGVMLPHPHNLAELGGFLHLSNYDPSATENPWYCVWEYDSDKGYMKREILDAATEANCRALALIYLLENNWIDVKDVNDRLITYSSKLMNG